jgi:hypothetical protein
VRKVAYVQHGSQFMAITREQFKAANKGGAASIASGPRIEISPNGLGLHWPHLDAGLYIPAHIEGAFGSRRWMQQIGEIGGSARSAAKAKTFREHGKRGGRPKDKEAA